MANCEVRTEGSLALVVLNRPHKRNAINLEMRFELVDRLREADTLEGVAMIALTGADPAFSAGADLNDAGAWTAPGMARPENPGAVIRSLRRPVIAAVNGACYTGGLELALACDFIVASERATFAETHAKYGLLFGWGGSALLPRAVGLRFAKEMSITGRPVGAEEALHAGLVNHVVAHDQLVSFCADLARRAAEADPDALGAVLRLYDDGVGLPLQRQLELERSTRKERALDRSQAAMRWSARHQGRD